MKIRFFQGSHWVNGATYGAEFFRINTSLTGLAVVSISELCLISMMNYEVTKSRKL